MSCNNFKYLAHNTEDRNWGIYLTVVGSARVEPNNQYPPPGHPSGYHFNWNNGRVLQEYQINYITEGEGHMETRDGSYHIREGSVIVLKPDLWHRYRPLKNTGWTEHYVGFMGTSANAMMMSAALLRDTPVVQVGFHENIIRIFQDIENLIKAERPGYQQISSGLLIQLLGHIISLKKNENFKHGQVEKSIQKACLIIREHPSDNLRIEELAEQVNLNYSIFRKAFKRYTGLSPMQYHSALRLKQATHLLTNTEMSIKEISFELGFCSVFYFSKLFKEKTRMTPGEFKKKNGNA
ncbi:MAG: AraC family transcriptional regulator [Bacteroidales bacterium]|nr:AraC family transcriptional regulator [Bacteroidales bacterium]